jgi:hypothetical protein
LVGLCDSPIEGDTSAGYLSPVSASLADVGVM